MTQYYDDTAREYAERAEAAAASAHQSKQQASTAATTATTQANIAVNAAANATTLVKSDLEAAVGQMKQDALSAATQSSDAASAASGSAVTASQAAIDAREWATRASASAVAAAGSNTMASQAAAEAHDWAVQAMNYIPLELQAPPTQSTVATLGRLALWRDETAGAYHAYHLVGITEGDNPEYQWEECVLESMLGVPDGVATLDANGKVPASQLPSGQGAEPVILDAPPTAATEGTLGQLGLWRDATNNTDHVYVLVFTSTSAGATMYHWDECVLESARNVPDGFAGLDANGKVAPAQLPVPAGNNIGAVKANTAQGTQVDNSGYLTLTQASVNEINTRATNRKPIIPSTLNHAVTAALTDENHITLDAAQQATVQTVFNVPDIDAAGASLGLSIDPQTYVMTLALKNAAGDTLDTKTVDLPLETMVVSASYANGILTLTLQSGATTDIDISALVDGLIPASEKGAVNGVATLGNDGKVPSAQLPTIPTALSQLTADSTHRTVTDAEKQTWNAKSDFSGDYDDLTDKPTIPSKTSDLTNDSGFQTASDVATAISGKADESALTAHTGNTTIHVTAADKTAWNAKSDFSGSYNDLTNKPDIPDSADDIGAIPATEKGANNGVATLGNDGKVPDTQLPDFGLPVLSGTTDPTYGTAAEPGQCYINTTDGTLFYCASIRTDSPYYPDGMYYWNKVFAGENVVIPKTLFIGVADQYTYDPETYSTLAAGRSITQQKHAYCDIAFGQNIHQDGTYLLALGGNIDQQMSSGYVVSVGTNITAAMAGPALAVGDHITQSYQVNSIAVGDYISQLYASNAIAVGSHITTDRIACVGAAYFGSYNAPVANDSPMRVTGHGTADNARKNIEELTGGGDLYITGGYRQGITVIPAATAAYTLKEGVFTHAPESAPTYTLPDVTDTTRTHRIELIVDFTAVQTFAFVDSSNTTVAIMYSPAISAGDVYAFEMEYNATLGRWTIFPKLQGTTPCVPPPFEWYTHPQSSRKGSSGQLCLDTANDRTYLCLDVKSGTEQNPTVTRTWRCVPSGKGGILTQYLAITNEAGYYTKTNNTARVLGIGPQINQSDTSDSLAIGSVTQTNTSKSIIAGLGSQQKTYCDYSISVGSNIIQTNVIASAAFGLSINQHNATDCIVVGVANEQGTDAGTIEGSIEVGIGLKNDVLHGTAYFGMFNAPAPDAVRVTGRGSSKTDRKNIEELSEAGDLYITGGYRQGITVIPAATAAYTLSEGVFTHAPAASPTYTLPAVTDATRTHGIELTVDFTTVQTYAFVDSEGTTVTPVSTPVISAGDIYTFKMEYSSVLDEWLVYPEKHGAVTYATEAALSAHTGNTTIHVTSADKTAWNAKSDFSGSYNDLTNKPTIPSTAADVNAIPAAEKGANNGVATLGSNGKVPDTQLPDFGLPVLSGTTDPGYGTIAAVGQCYLNTATGSMFYCASIGEATDYYTDGLHFWNKLHTGAEVQIGRYVFIGLNGQYTVNNDTYYTLGIGTGITQNTARRSIAAGHTITQGASDSVAVGYNITQTYTGQYSAAFGSNITQQGIPGIAVGDNITQNYSSYVAAFGTHIIQQYSSGGIAAGYYLTTDGGGSHYGNAYFGKFNAPSTNTMRVTGGGTADNDRKNIEELSTSGDLYITGGHQQQITTIPTATTAYTLAEGVYVHVPATVATYTLPTLPTLTDITRTHEIIIDVEFSADTSVTFQDSSSVEIEPLSEPETEAGTVVSYLCRYNLLLGRWVIMPVVQGVAGA